MHKENVDKNGTHAVLKIFKHKEIYV